MAAQNKNDIENFPVKYRNIPCKSKAFRMNACRHLNIRKNYVQGRIEADDRKRYICDN
jgi:hypothetical protein